MASKKKNSSKKQNIEEVSAPVEEIVIPVEEVAAPIEEAPAVIEAVETEEVKEVAKPEKKAKKETVSTQKFAIGALVYINRDVEADLNGFCLFSQYKKDPYTVESYDAVKDVYTLRRQKLLVRLKERDIMAPDENAHDSVNRKQY